jgi:prepilin-type N-terminal cleavage/methylation domain-containing protein
VRSDQHGFTLLETAIAMVLMAIVGLGVASLFVYAARNTVSAGDRELAMAVAQQTVEQLRNVAFTDASLTATSSSGTSATVTRAGRQYSVVTTITDSNVINGSATAKTISVKVTPLSDGSSWASTIASVFGSVTLVSQRTALTMGPNRAL